MSQICNLCKDTSIVKRHSQMAFSKQKCQRWCICVLWRWCVCPRDTFHGQPCLSYRWQSVARVWQGVNEAWASFADDKYYKNQRDVIYIPKSVKNERMKQNIEVLILLLLMKIWKKILKRVRSKTPKA